MKGRLTVGMRWEHMEVISLESKDTEVWEDGIEVVEKVGREWAKLKCDCGVVLGMWAKDWPGKRAMPDCGTCGTAARDERKVNVMVYLNESLRRELTQSARRHKVSLSQHVRDILGQYLSISKGE